ncbi:MAG: hypothetical protein WCL30_03375, partial [Pseudomonadota bacterium]
MNIFVNEKPLVNRAYILCFLSVFVFHGCLSLRIDKSSEKKDNNPIDVLKSKISQRFDDSLFSHAHWGVLVK